MVASRMTDEGTPSRSACASLAVEGGRGSDSLPFCHRPGSCLFGVERALARAVSPTTVTRLLLRDGRPRPSGATARTSTTRTSVGRSGQNLADYPEGADKLQLVPASPSVQWLTGSDLRTP